MIRLLGRKIILILLLIPVLNALGFYYAVTYPNPGHGPALGPPPVRPSLAEAGAAYGEYARGLLQGDWGQINVTPLVEIVVPAINNSLILLAITLVIAAVAGPILGFLSISRRQRRITLPALLLTTAGSSMPGFFLGVMILALMIYGIISSAARGTPLPLSGFGLDEHLILPVLVLSAGPTLQIARIAAGLLENEIQQDYVRVARSKGLSWPAILLRHALPNVAAPILITIGQSMRLFISGLIVVEALFLWPGIGRLFTAAVGIRIDGREPLAYFLHPQLLATLAVVFGVGLLLADLVATALAHWSDPRLKQPAEA